mgnify:CR=1 FL=1
MRYMDSLIKKGPNIVAGITILLLTPILVFCNRGRPEAPAVKKVESSDSVTYQKTTTYEFDSDEVDGNMQKPAEPSKPKSPLTGGSEKAPSPEKPTHTDNNTGIQKPIDAGPKQSEH